MADPSPIDSVEYDEQSEEVITGEAVALDLRPAGLVLRAGGAIIDILVYLLACGLGMYALGLAAASGNLDGALVQAVVVVGLVLFLLVVPVAVEVLTHGKSLGKLAVGARIVRDDGGAIGLRHAAIRGVVGLLENYTGLALLAGLLNSRAKRVGDMLAGTYSQHERIPQFQIPIYGVPTGLVEWASTADVARMPDGLSRRIAQYLEHVSGLSPDTRVRLGRQLASEASIYVSPLPVADAELFLAAIASLRRDREYTALQLQARRLQQLAPVLRGMPHRFPPR